jgi:DNA-binding NtrC family response regulator
MAQEQTSNHTRPTVLIVDDDAEIREVVRGALQEAEFATLEAADGVAALDILQAHADPLVVLLDILLPQLDGAALLGIVARNHHLALSNTYVLMTGKPIVAFPVLRRLATELGAIILPKPFDIPRLLEAVERAAAKAALAHSAAASPNQVGK